MIAAQRLAIAASTIRESALFTGDTEQATDLARELLGQVPPGLSLIGHDRAVIDGFAGKLHATARTEGDYTGVREGRRDSHFEVKLATGHVVRVTIELERLEGLTSRIDPSKVTTAKGTFKVEHTWATPANLRAVRDPSIYEGMNVTSGRWRPITDRYFDDCVIEVPFRLAVVIP